ncbi:MAG: universal stress protein [Planctomycetia bacterium]|nr:universal stress protein [Planctomycetia bacterium]
MYKHILIPLENSAADETILTHIRGLARLTGARLTLLHVADGFMARNQEQLGLDESDEMREDRAYLKSRESELAAEGFPVDIILACGEPTEHIVAIAEREGCDLIAMSTHGHRLLGDLILGTVASEVRHRTDIPVLLVRAPRKG